MPSRGSELDATPTLPSGFPASKWRYIDRLLASYGHPSDKAGRKWLRELRDRAVDHEKALLEIKDCNSEVVTAGDGGLSIIYYDAPEAVDRAKLIAHRALGDS